MPIANSSVPVGATYAPTGGVATSFVELGKTENSNKLYLDDSSEIIDTTTLLVQSRAPTPNAGAPGGYTQQRASFRFHVPLLLDNGERTINVVQGSVSFDPETNSVEREALWDLMRHVSIDGDFAEFRDRGSMS